MSIRCLCMAPDRTLRTPARAVEAFTESFQILVRDLIETMYANDGIGLAAPQIGQAIQVFVANPSRQRGREVVVANPILEGRDGTVWVREGCLSLPRVWAKVRRAARIRLRGQDLSGEPLQIEADGFAAVVFQHEYDHLHGTLLIDRLPWYHPRRLRARLTWGSCA